MIIKEAWAFTIQKKMKHTVACINTTQEQSTYSWIRTKKHKLLPTYKSEK